MKKVLIAAMFFGLAGLACAALSFQVNDFAVGDGGQYVMAPGHATVGVVNSNIFTGGIDIGFIGVTAATTSDYEPDIIIYLLPWNWTVEPIGVDGGFFYWQIVTTVPPIGPINTGTLFEVGFTVHDTCEVRVLDNAYTILASCTIVPEPASAMIMLLGASWIAARRKR